MLRPQTSAALRNAIVRASKPSTLGCRAVSIAATDAPAQTSSSTHAISNPTLANIEKRWEGMPMQEQAELWMALRDRMKGSWAELTLQEKKAGKSAITELGSFAATPPHPIPVTN